MTTTQLLGLLLALSFAFNFGFAIAVVARASGQHLYASVLIAIGLVVPTLGVYFTALAAYR
ncbi:hypothetical protein [Nocardia fluminea]|uniref:hypothetical protein n=1 Tax=Nocardia fluminea TaxID=134984 RepID=UPI0036591DC8